MGLAIVGLSLPLCLMLLLGAGRAPRGGAGIVFVIGLLIIWAVSAMSARRKGRST